MEHPAFIGILGCGSNLADPGVKGEWREILGKGEGVSLAGTSTVLGTARVPTLWTRMY